MDWKSEWKPLAWMMVIFGAAYYLPVGMPRFDNALHESLYLIKWYAREHVVLCLLPAFFIAGGISVFISQASVIRYLGAGAKPWLAYGVASVSGSVLAVCSCTVLPLFAGIYKRGAGLGPAIAFLYSGPAINVLAIILTARILGVELGLARALGAVFFSLIIGLLMHWIFSKEEQDRQNQHLAMPDAPVQRTLRQNTLFFGAQMGILIFANWGQSQDPVSIWNTIYQFKWIITAGWAVLLGILLYRWFAIGRVRLILTALIVGLGAFLFRENPIIPFAIGILGLSFLTASGPEESREWFSSTWGYAKQIFPLLIFGVMAAGLALGRPGQEGLIPSAWVHTLVGGNSISSNLFASLVGAFMYFATLTEIPILQGLIGSGMGQGPALALLLAGPALSLPSMLVIRSVIGTRKMLVYVVLVVIMSTLTGMIFGQIRS
ncbi:MAG: permease [Candidatus Delongbacteria bacterium]|nr:permease [Candidatus Delongbacteria bacterium]